MVVRVKKRKKTKRLKYPRSRSVNQANKRQTGAVRHGSRTRWKEERQTSTSTTTTTL